MLLLLLLLLVITVVFIVINGVCEMLVVVVVNHPYCYRKKVGAANRRNFGTSISKTLLSSSNSAVPIFSIC